MVKIRPPTETAILAAAFAALAQDRSASLGAIAARAGVGRATLHRHFASREALLLACAQHAVAELDAAVDAATADAQSYGAGLRLAFEAMVPLGDRFLFLSQEVFDSDPAMAAKGRADRAELIREIAQAQAEGCFARDLPAAWIATAYEALLYGAWEMVRDGDATPAQAARFGWRVLTHGAERETP